MATPEPIEHMRTVSGTRATFAFAPKKSAPQLKIDPSPIWPCGPLIFWIREQKSRPNLLIFINILADSQSKVRRDVRSIPYQFAPLYLFSATANPSTAANFIVNDHDVKPDAR